MTGAANDLSRFRAELKYNHNELAWLSDNLTSITRLKEIVESRRQDAQRGERLRVFIVRGRLVLCGSGTLGFISDEPRRDPKLDMLAPVVDVVEARRVFDDLMIGWCGVADKELPNDGDRCPHCERAWTIETLHEATRTPGGVKHVVCLARERACDEESRLRTLFTKAGFPPGQRLRPIQNGYWKSDTAPPWFQMTTVAGEITIGWRKRVISIEWTGRNADGIPRAADNLFDDLGVITHEPGLVHAWSEENAIAYLRRIREHYLAKDGSVVTSASTIQRVDEGEAP